MTDRIELNFAEIAKTEKESQERRAVWDGYMRQAAGRPEGAVTLAGLARDYPTLNPELGAAIVASGMSADDPNIHQIIELDTHESSKGILGNAWGAVQGATRMGLATFRDAWDNSFPRYMQTVVNMGQGANIVDAWDTSGQTMLSGVIEDTQLKGRPPTFTDVYGQSGFMPGDSQDMALTPGSSEVFKGYAEQGYDPKTALEYTRAWQTQHDAGSIYDKVTKLRESTMLHNNLADGSTVAYNASFGRMTWYPLLQNMDPDSAFFKAVTGSTDLFGQAFLDPLNPGFDWVSQGVSAHRTATRAADLSANETADLVAQMAGGRKIDGSDADIAFHGTSVEKLTDDVIREGGITNRYEEAKGFVTEEGQLHVVDPEQLPERLKNLYEDSDGTYKSIEQLISETSAVEAFPDMNPNQLGFEVRRLIEARRTVDSPDSLYKAARAMDESGQTTGIVDELIATYDPSYLDEIGLTDAEWTITGDFLSTPQQVREVVSEWDYADDLLEEIDRYIAAHEIIDSGPLSGTMTPTQDALIKRVSLHTEGDSYIWGQIDESIQPSASFTAAEVREMESYGYVFKTREGFLDYRKWHKDISEAGGVKARGKWFVNPATWERYSSTSRGKRIFQWAADADYTAIQRSGKFSGMSDDLKWRLHHAKDPGTTEAIIKQWYGGPSSNYKVPVRSRTANAMSAVQRRFGGDGQIFTSKSPRLPERLTVLGRRLSAEMGHSTLDPYDMDVTFDYVNSMGRLLGKTDTEITNAMSWLDEAQPRINPNTGKKIENLRERGMWLQEEIYDWLRKDLAIDHGQEYADGVIDAWRKAEAKNRVFAENANGTPLEMRNAPGRRMRNDVDGSTLDIFGGEPLYDSHLAQRNHFMPSVREVRRATADVRKITEKWRTHDYGDLSRSVGLGTSRFQKGVDAYLAGWRNLALLRIGWMMRVLPDELARFYVSGYNDMATDPLSYILYSMGKKGDYLDESTSLHQITEAMGLGADNGLFRGADNAAYVATSQRGANWTRVEATRDGVNLTPEGANGVSRRFLQLYQSDLQRVIYDHATIDDAVRYLVDDVDGNGILKKIWSSSEPGSQLRDAASYDAGSQELLRHVLEGIDAQRHQYTGGAWVGKDRNGNWVDMYGDNVELYDFDKETLKNLARDRNLTVRGNRTDLRNRLLGKDGLPANLWKSNSAYVVTRQGQPELLEAMRHGRMQGTPNPNRAKVNAARDWYYEWNPKVPQADNVYVIMPEFESIAAAAKRSGGLDVYTSFDSAALKLDGPDTVIRVIDKESLDPSALMQKVNKDGTITMSERQLKYAQAREGALNSDELRMWRDNALQEGEYSLLHDSMTPEDFKEFEGFLTGAYTVDNPPVKYVAAPDKPYFDLEDQQTIIDQMFKAIGQNPTLFGVRRPFATLRTWENMAGHYVTATPAVRKAIMESAEKAGMTDRFARFVQNHLDSRGWTRPIAQHTDTLEDIVGYSWAAAIDDTKDIFYDLTKGAAWADASRIVFPFADAWWEVLSRWGKLANPAVTGGQSIKALDRAGTAMMAAESSGWFTQNEQGKRVFEIPGTANVFNAINKVPGIEMSSEVSLDQLTFVDFGDPTTALKPGFSPPTQWAAAEVRNLTFDKGWFPESWRDTFDTAFFGEFAPPAGLKGDFEGTLGMFLPTHMRRGISRIWQGEFDDDYASLQVRFANGMAARIGEEAATNPDVARKIVEEARNMATLVGTVDIFSSFVSPAQPRKVAEILLTDEQGTEYVKSLTALATDFRFMKDLYGANEAVEVFRKAYGFDPLKLAPTYWSDERAPVTNDSWEFMLANPQIGEHTKYTTMAWVPQGDESEFDIDAWRAAEYERLTGSDAAEYWSYAAGAHRLAVTREARDMILEDLEIRYGGTDNSSYRYMKSEVVDPWYKLESWNIDTQYYGYVPGEGLAGVSNRPSYERIWNELEHIGTRGSEANNELRQVDPNLVNFIEYATELWGTMEQSSIDKGYGHEWWQTSTSVENAAPELREIYSNALTQYAESLPREARTKAEYIGQYFMAPLLEGFDWDNPVVIATSIPSPDQLGYADQLGARENG